MVAAAISKDQNKFVTNTRGLVQSAKKQMQAQMLSTMYGEVVKNLELSKTMAAHNEPLIQVIDAPRFPLRKRQSQQIKRLGVWRVDRRLFNGTVDHWPGCFQGNDGGGMIARLQAINCEITVKRGLQDIYTTCN